MSEGKIIFYKGSRGKGKTLTMVKDGFDYYVDKWVIYSNFQVGYGSYISNDEIINLDKTTFLHDCVIMIDEIQILFDSRNWKLKGSSNFSYFLQQIRKRNIIILATSQFVNLVDKRFRQQIDIFAYPEFIEQLDYCKVTYLKLDFTEDLDLEVISKGGLRDFVLQTTTIGYFTIPIYKLYNTYEMIA